MLERLVKTEAEELAQDGAPMPNAGHSKGRKVVLPVGFVVFWKEFSPLLRKMWPSVASTTTVLFVSQVCLALMYAWSYNYYAELTGTFASAIQENNKDKFLDTMLAMLASVLLGSFANSTILFLGDILTHEVWYAVLSRDFLARYLGPLVFYKVLPSVSDPDQRIAHDINNLCDKLKLILFGTPMYIGYVASIATTTWFTITLWARGGWVCPVLTYLYFVLFTVINQLLLIPVAKVGKEQASFQGEYRFAHTYLRIHAEHVAFLDGHVVEQRKLTKLLANIVNHARAVAMRTYPLNTCSQAFYWGSSCMAYLIPGISWWSGVGKANFNVEDFIAVSTIIASLMSQLSVMMLLSQEIAELVGITSRVSEMSIALDEVQLELSQERLKQRMTYDADNVVYRDVTFATPGNKVTMRHISFSVARDGRSNMLVMGPSGIGKSSILRVLGGLWPILDGAISKPKKIGRGGVTYMPQKPYLTLGTLKEQITYPDSATTITDEEAMACLRLVELDYIVTREPGLLHKTKMWSETLSGGEAQRLGVARIIFQDPYFAVLDECTSAMDEDIEAKAYEELCKRGITLISIAHRSTVKKFHHRLFKIAADGSFTLQPLTESIGLIGPHLGNSLGILPADRMFEL